jgi:hypothetical protein
MENVEREGEEGEERERAKAHDHTEDCCNYLS